MEGDTEQLGRTRSATNLRLWSASTSSSSPTPGSRSNRVVANADQVSLLKKYLDRTGLDGTKEHLLGEVALETGLCVCQPFDSRGRCLAHIRIEHDIAGTASGSANGF